MSATIINGKEIAEQIHEELKQRVAKLKAAGKTPGLVVVQVGDNPSSTVYVNKKAVACEALGIFSRVIRLPEDTTQQQLLDLVDKLNADERFHGILVQIPLPAHINELQVISRIDPGKDVDGLHPVSAGRLLTGNKGFVSCTPKGVMRLLNEAGVDPAGKNAVVVGRSNLVGKPVAILLLQQNATVTLCHSKTKDLAEVTSRADILVAAMGKPGLLRGEYVKPGAVVIDVGTTKVDGKLKGDVYFPEAMEKAAAITPVPGGVGPMTIVMLMENTIDSCEFDGYRG